MTTQKEQSIIDALEEQAAECGIEIVAVEVVGAKKSPTIRVYIDTPQGVSFDELSSAQAWINQIMDAIDPFPGAYTLEVSSPGIDRPLRTIEHFERYAGETAVLVTSRPIEGRSKYTGKLAGVENEKVMIQLDGAIKAIDFELIKRAHMKGAIDFSSKE